MGCPPLKKKWGQTDPGEVNPPRPPIFKTPAADGPFRDEVVVEILTLNGVSYMGTITPVEARGMIYDGALGLDQKIWPASRSGSTEEE